MQPCDIQGRALGGLFQACHATNHLHKQRRLEYRYLLALSTSGKSLQGTDLVVQGNVLTTLPCAVVVKAGLPVTRKTENAENDLLRRNSSQQKLDMAMNDQESGPEKKRRKKLSRAAAVTVLGQASAQMIGGVETQQNLVAPAAVEPQHVEVVPLVVPGSGKRGKQAAEELFCVCQLPWNEHRFGIECDGCKDWFHPECLGYLHSAKKENCLVDVDGVKSVNVETLLFSCPQCELRRGAVGTTQAEGADIRRSQAGPSTAARFYRWSDVADVADGSEREISPVTAGANLLSNKDGPCLAAVRWKYLMQARNQEPGPIAPCLSCKLRHHPRLPCTKSGGSVGVSPRGEDAEVGEDVQGASPVKLSAQSPPLFVLIIAGKFQSLSGTMIASSKKWAQIVLDIDDISRVIVPRSAVLTSKSQSFKIEKSTESESTYIGVLRSPQGGYAAVIDIVPGDESSRLALGRFTSAVRAARVYDVAARLQFGESALGFDELNFPDLSRIVVPAPGKNQVLTGWEHVLALAQQMALGPPCPANGLLQTPADALMVLDWVEGMEQALDQYPPHMERLLTALDNLRQSLLVHAEEAASHIGASLGNTRVEVGAEEEDLETLLRKYSRNRNAKQRPRKD